MLLHGAGGNADTGLGHEGTSVGGAELEIDGQRGDKVGAVGVYIVVEAVEGLASNISAGGNTRVFGGKFPGEFGGGNGGNSGGNDGGGELHGDGRGGVVEEMRLRKMRKMRKRGEKNRKLKEITAEQVVDPTHAPSQVTLRVADMSKKQKAAVEGGKNWVTMTLIHST